MKKFAGYAVVFLVGVSHGRMIERVRSLTRKEVLDKSNQYADMLAANLADES